MDAPRVAGHKVTNGQRPADAMLTAGVPLQPAARPSVVLAVSTTETPLEIALLPRDDAIAHSDGNREHQEQYPCAAHRQPNRGVDEKHGHVDRVAAPAVNSASHECSCRLGPRNRSAGACKNANTRSEQRDARTAEAAGNGGADPARPIEPFRW